ncbi:hypothetical protein RV18_GL003564 [Enterococcus termitis]|nr:hypothetical protein RV18_GL003564 [Enterococcus termitis]
MNAFSIFVKNIVFHFIYFNDVKIVKASISMSSTIVNFRSY